MNATNSPEVRGIALIAIREYIQSSLGLRDAGEFVKRLRSESAYTFLNAEKGDWYPFPLQTELHNGIIKWFNPADPRKAIFALGIFKARYEINSFLKTVLNFLPLGLVLNRAQLLWSKFYRPGCFKVCSSHQAGAVFELTGFESDPHLCVLVEAWLRVAGEILKLKDVEVSETACIHKGADRCRWEVSWQPPKAHSTSAANQEASAGLQLAKGNPGPTR
jgi:hypothetical protein